MEDLQLPNEIILINSESSSSCVSSNRNKASKFPFYNNDSYNESTADYLSQENEENTLKNQKNYISNIQVKKQQKIQCEKKTLIDIISDTKNGIPSKIEVIF